MSKKKKIIVLVSMVALLVLTGCLNYFLNRPKSSEADSNGTTMYTDYFTSSRNDREQARNQTVMENNAIIKSESASAEAKANAEKELAQLVAGMETEQRLETLIKALGYEACLVSVGAQNINVILKSEKLTDQEVAQILDIIMTETDKTAANVRIKPINV